METSCASEGDGEREMEKGRWRKGELSESLYRLPPVYHWHTGGVMHVGERAFLCFCRHQAECLPLLRAQ